MAKEFISVFKPEEITETRPLPSKIRVKGAKYNYTEAVKDQAHYANLLYRARLTCELHNRDHGKTDPWEIQEEREKVVEVVA